jgi:cyclic-di-GMP phosphodiesterase TipF (flagellum assembly factor)
MIRLSALLIAICMVVIAGSLGLVLYLTFGVTGAEAAVVALTALTGFSVYNAVATRMRYQSELSAQLGDLSRGTADLARQVGEQGRRLASLEKGSDAAIQKAFSATQPLQAEISELSVMLRQVTQAVATQDAAITKLSAGGVVHASSAPPLAADAPTDLAMPSMMPDKPAAEAPKANAPLQLSDVVNAGPFRGMAGTAVVAAIREAIGANRIEVYLQPVVTLPQRKVRYYEALMRLRMNDNVIAAADFLPFAEAGMLMASLDYLMVARCVRVLRRLQEKTRDVGVFCNISAITLSDREIMAQILDFAEANRVLGPVLTFELPYPAVRAMGARENESLARLTDLGFRLSVDHVSDLRFDARELADRKCAFMKIPASVLLGRAMQASSNIHPQDIAGLLLRNGIELIAEKVESEATVVDLLDFDLKFGQGNLFSPPRPVKQEAPRSAAEEAAATIIEAKVAAVAPPASTPLMHTPQAAVTRLPEVEPALPLAPSPPQPLPLADFKIGFSIEDKAEKPAEPEVQPAPIAAAVPAIAPVVAPAPQSAVERAPVIEPRRNTIDRDSALARLAKIVARQ